MKRIALIAVAALAIGCEKQEAGVWQGYIEGEDRKSTRLNSSHSQISYAVFCLKKKTQPNPPYPRPASLPSGRAIVLTAPELLNGRFVVVADSDEPICAAPSPLACTSSALLTT